MGGRPRKLPERDELVRLYVEENLSTPRIAQMFGLTDPHPVRVQLLRAGVTLRRHTTTQTCKATDCAAPVVKIKHKALNSEYGGLCAQHREQHYRLLNRGIRRRNRPSAPRRWWQLNENKPLVKQLQTITTAQKQIKQTLKERGHGETGQ